MRLSVALSLTVAVLARAGTVVWDGSFDPFSTPDDFAKWSWANQVGTYQYVSEHTLCSVAIPTNALHLKYIHGRYDSQDFEWLCNQLTA
jgi:hypothetical protein